MVDLTLGDVVTHSRGPAILELRGNGQFNSTSGADLHTHSAIAGLYLDGFPGKFSTLAQLSAKAKRGSMLKQEVFDFHELLRRS